MYGIVLECNVVPSYHTAGLREMVIQIQYVVSRDSVSPGHTIWRTSRRGLLYNIRNHPYCETESGLAKTGHIPRPRDSRVRGVVRSRKTMFDTNSLSSVDSTKVPHKARKGSWSVSTPKYLNEQQLEGGKRGTYRNGTKPTELRRKGGLRWRLRQNRHQTQGGA